MPELKPAHVEALLIKPETGFKIDKQTLEHLDPLTKLVAEMAIRKGLWILIDE